MCGDYDKLASTLIAATSKDSFYYKPAAEAYRVIMERLREKGTTPDWTEIIADPSISEDTRKILKSSKEVPAVSREKVSSIITTLDKYRKLRGIVNLAQFALDNIEDKQVDLDEVIDHISDTLVKVRSRGDAKTSLHHFGKGNNTTPLLKEMLYGKQKPSIPTGFRAFDERNGGILLGSLWTIGANTGGGKTTMAVNLLRNMTEFAAEDCCIVPLEMTATQTTDRLMGILTGLEVNKISQKRLSDGEKKLVKGAYRKYVQTLKQNNTRYTIYEPEEDISIEEVLMTLKPMGYRVILIDYISLLKGADGDDQWRQLGNIARFAKMFAKTNNCIVVLLCQVSEEGRIRYAQAIAEHCFTGDTWIDTPTGPRQIVELVGAHETEFHGRADFKVTTENATGNASAVHYNGVKPVYKMTLSNGSSLKSTKTHKYMVLRKDLTIDWVPLSDIRVGDMVAQNTVFNWPTRQVKLGVSERKHYNAIATKLPKTVNTNMGYFLGGLLSNGYVGADKIEWVSTDKDSAIQYFHAAHKLFPGAAKLHEHKTQRGTPVWRVQLYQSDAIECVRSIEGMNNGAVGKFIPDVIMRSPKNVVAACLRGMFDGDGSAVKGQVYLTTWSSEMASRLQLLLQRFGIRSKLSKPNEGYRVTITCKDNLDRFNTEIGFVAKRKTAMLARVLSTKAIQDKVPFVSEWLIQNGHRDLAHQVSSQWQNEKKSGYAHGCLRSRLSVLSKHLPEKRTVLKQLQAFDWCAVTDISYAGKQPVYDITVDNTHSYVANGSVVHNSNNAWIWTMPGEESDTSIIEIKQLKARNQQRFGFQLLSHNASMQITDAEDVSTGEEDDDEGGEPAQAKHRKAKGGKDDDSYLRDINDPEEGGSDDDDEDSED